MDLSALQLALLGGSFVPWALGKSLVVLLRAVDAGEGCTGIWESGCDTAECVVTECEVCVSVRGSSISSLSLG